MKDMKIPVQGYECRKNASGNVIKPCLSKPIHQQVYGMSEQLRAQRMKDTGEKYDASILAWHREDGVTVILTEPTTIISKAIEQIEQMGDYKVMVALVDLDKTKPKEEQLMTFTDIESKKLREVIYKEMEKEM